MVTDQAGYWDETLAAFKPDGSRSLWRAHSDLVNANLLTRWLPEKPDLLLLKTDLFDEALGEGLYPSLTLNGRRLAALDISGIVARRARDRHPHLVAVQGDVRRLPFAAGVFDAVVSNSTLDHFPSRQDIVAGLQELHRVLRSGGRLILTLDNPLNPLLALRQALPFRLLRRLGLVTYYLGRTLSPGALGRILREMGFHLREAGAILHCPRVLAVPLAHLLEQGSRPTLRRRYLRFLAALERLEHWPTRYVTGHFLAVLAVKAG